MSIELEIIAGPGMGQQKLLATDRVLIGRRADCDFACPYDKGISMTHAVLNKSVDGWDVVDMNSKNGVFVISDGCRTRVSEASVSDGQIIGIGVTEILISIHSSDKAQEEKPPVEPAMEGKDTLLLRVSYSGDRLKFQMISHNAVGRQLTMVCELAELEEAAAAFGDSLSEARSDSSADAVEGLLELSGFFSNRFLPGRLADKLRESIFRHILLLLEPNVLHFPWELLSMDGKLLCLKFNLSRQLIADDVSTTFRYSGSSDRFLIVSNPTQDVEDASSHAEELFFELRERCSDLAIEYVGGAVAKRLALLDAFEKCRVLYFVGHAKFNHERPLDSFLPVADGVISCRDLVKVQSPPLLAFVNACQTARMRDSGNVHDAMAYGIGSAFLLTGVRSYIGTIIDVDARTAAAMAEAFFNHFLLQGRPMAEALRLSRLEVKNNACSCLDWAAYVSYGSPSCTMFSWG